MTSTRVILAQTEHAATGSTASNEKKEPLQLPDFFLTPRDSEKDNQEKTKKIILDRRNTYQAIQSKRLAESSARAATPPVPRETLPPREIPPARLRRPSTMQ